MRSLEPLALRRTRFVPARLALMAVAIGVATRAAIAQVPAKADGVFDDESPAAAKAAAPKPGPGAKGKGAEKPRADAAAKPFDRDALGFTQENAAAQMSELEARMFRLSEALKGLEPENASRLRLALKFSREELILEQMRDANRMLKEAQLNRAESEVRQLLAKLEHLRNVLLAEDLDFQLKLARLRQMRESLNQLERIVKEERRELGWSRFAIDQKKARGRLTGRRPDLEAIARDQDVVIAETRAIAGDRADSARKAARESASAKEAKVARAAAALAADPLFADFQPSRLRSADADLVAASKGLDGDDLAAASAAEGRAAATFREELARLDGRIAESDRGVAAAEFTKHEADQTRNRAATDALSAASSRLGAAGIALQKDLIQAAGRMKAAEGDLNRADPDPAATDQTAALELLSKSRDDLAEAAEKLLVQLRVELQARIVSELTEMHEEQAAIRETTEAQAPRLAQKSRTAAVLVAGLAPKQVALGERLETLTALVEETEFGIALPTALRVLSREMRSVEGRLKETDASPKTIALERRIEEDLLGLVAAIRRLPPTTPPPSGSPLPSDLRDRERELNRLVAELKMIRLLQTRLNDETTGVDANRPADAPAPTLTPALRREVEALEAAQDEIRESLAKIAERAQQPQ